MPSIAALPDGADECVVSPVSVELKLPYPPSVNHYWRRVGNRTLISRRGRVYRRDVQWVCIAQLKGSFGQARLRIRISAHSKDRRTRDLDNLPKSVLDAMQKANVYEDDSQIDDLRITRGEIMPNDPHVVVRIDAIDGQ